MNENTISRLSRKLRSADNRLDAVEAIERIDFLDPEIADEIVDDLILALEAESNAYTLLRLLGVFERLAQDSPQVASKATVTMIEMLDTSIREFEGDDVSENRRASRETNILEAILDGTSPEDVTFDLKYKTVRMIIRQGNVRHRSIAYRLLGRTATGEAVRILLRDFSHELETVKNARENGLNHACTLVMSSLKGSGPLSRVATVDSFSELWAAGRINPDQEQLDTVRRETFAAIETVNGEQRETLLAAIERLARQDSETAEILVSEALGVLTKDPAGRNVMWDVLRACAEGAPEIVLDHADEIVTELERGDLADTQSALDVIKIGSKAVTTVPAVLATPVLGLIDSNEVEIAKHAVETVGTMGFYPIPEPLIELADQEHPSLSRTASQARKKLRQDQSMSGFASDFRTSRADVSLFDGDLGDVHLKCRTEGGYWTDITLGQLREAIVKTTTHRLEQGENVPISYPYYEPSDVVVLTLALVLKMPGEDRQVGLYSPGSQTQWGTKGEIRDKLHEFGLADVSGEVISAIPIPEVVPEAYVSEGRVKDHSEGEGPGRIVLTKSLSELTQVSDLDVALLNLTSKTKIDIRDEIEELEDEVPAVDVVSAYSYYTRNEKEGRPRYGPPTGLESTPTVPGPDLLDSVLTQTNSNQKSDPRGSDTPGVRATHPEVFGDDNWQTGDDDVRSLCRRKKIRIDHVETKRLAGLFDQLFEESAGLFDTDAAGAGGLIFSRQMFFERLPIPPDDFDEWVRNRYEQGDRFVPPLVRERIGDVEQKANTVDNLEAVQPLNTAKQLLDRIHEQLREHNPLFEKLQTYIEEAKQTGDRLAIFSTSPKNAQLLRDTLVEYDLVSRDDLNSGRISVVSPDEAKKMKQHETMLVFGSLHPENAGFYVHPRVDETVVVTYDRTWAKMIERHASEFVTLLNDVVGEAGYTPYAEPDLKGDLPREPDKETVDKAATVPSSADEPSAKSKMEILEDAMRSASATEYGEEASRYERELRRYRVVTDDGTPLRLTNRENVLRQSSASEEGDVHWINPDSLSVGDTLVTLPDEIEEELWREHLQGFYEDETDAGMAIERVRTWHDSLNEIWNRAADELGSEDEISEIELTRRLHNWISEENDDFDRVFTTVRAWFVSGREADSAMELVQDPSLIIGPQSARDIAAVGRAFGYDELRRDAEEIQGAMKGLRTINRQEGHKYRDSIRDRLSADEVTPVSEGASYREVTEISEVGENSDQESDTEEVPDDLDTQLLQRVVDIVELAPATNGDLCGAWGYDSGSEVYQFLSSNLDEYYKRNENSLIVPTERAKRVARVATSNE